MSQFDAFSALLPNSRWHLHVLPVLSSSISPQHVLQHAAVHLKKYFTIFSSTLFLVGRSSEFRHHWRLVTFIYFHNSMSKGNICITAVCTPVMPFDKNWFLLSIYVALCPGLSASFILCFFVIITQDIQIMTSYPNASLIWPTILSSALNFTQISSILVWYETLMILDRMSST